jgi:hypothetical protein
MKEDENSKEARRDFIRDIVTEDCKTDKWGGRVHTRFLPEPNGYLNIGFVMAKRHTKYALRIRVGPALPMGCAEASGSAVSSYGGHFAQAERKSIVLR